MLSYYPLASFGLLGPIAVLWSVVTNLYGRFCLPPLPPLPSPPHCSNKLAIVTGCNTGIGKETAQALLDRGCTVILACRSRDKALQAFHKNPKNDLFVAPLDLCDPSSIHRFVQALPNDTTIDILVLNAGRNTSGDSDGLDLCFQANFLGHWQLVRQLLQDQRLSTATRVVCLSSVMHHFCGDNIHQLDSKEAWKEVLLWRNNHTTYALSKLAMILLAIELRTKYGVTAVAVNPGGV